MERLKALRILKRIDKFWVTEEEGKAIDAAIEFLDTGLDDETERVTLDISEEYALKAIAYLSALRDYFAEKNDAQLRENDIMLLNTAINICYAFCIEHFPLEDTILSDKGE